MWMLTYVSTPLLVPNVSMNGVRDILEPVTLSAIFMTGNVVFLIVPLSSHRWERYERLVMRNILTNSNTVRLSSMRLPQGLISR